MAERETVPLKPTDSALPVRVRRCTFSSCSFTAAESWSLVSAPRRSPAHAARPPSMRPVTSAVSRIVVLSRASCPLMRAVPATFWPATAANGATSGRRNSSWALCSPAVTARPLSVKSRCSAENRTGRVLSSSRIEPETLRGESCSNFGCGPGRTSPSREERRPRSPRLAVRFAVSAATWSPPGTCSCRACRVPSATACASGPCQRPCSESDCHERLGEGLI